MAEGDLRSARRLRSSVSGRHGRLARITQSLVLAREGVLSPELASIEEYLGEQQIEQAAARWAFLERLAGERGWPDRFVIALEQALIGGTDRGSYSAEADISAGSATNHFRRLLDAGLLSQRGRGRSTRYHASDALRRDAAAAIDAART